MKKVLNKIAKKKDGEPEADRSRSRFRNKSARNSSAGSNASGSRSESRERQQSYEFSSDDEDDARNNDYELTTTNVMNCAVSLTASISEIELDAWQELGDDDFPMPPDHKEKLKNRSLIFQKSSRSLNVEQYPDTIESSSVLTSEGIKKIPQNDISFQQIEKFQSDVEEIINNFDSAFHALDSQVSENKDREDENLETSCSAETVISMGGESTSSVGSIHSADISHGIVDNAVPLESAAMEDNNIDNQTSRSEHISRSKCNEEISSKSRKATNAQQSSAKNVQSGKAIRSKSPNTNGNKSKPILKKYNSRIPPSSTPPGKHRITIYNSAVEKQGASIIPKNNPLQCNFVQFENDKMPRGGGHHQVFISDREYRLLYSFAPPPRRKTYQVLEKAPDRHHTHEKTLFGWVSAANNESSNSKLLNPKINLTKSRAPGNLQQRNSSRFPPGELSMLSTPSTNDFCENTTNSDFLLHLAKLTNSDREVQTGNLNDGEWNRFQGYKSKSNSTTGLRGSNPLEDVAGNMRLSILNASETSVVLMKTIFKDLFDDPAVSSLFEQSEQFQDFINATNEFSALEKAANIFGIAEENIYNYLSQLKNEFDLKYNVGKESSERTPPAVEVEVSPRIGNTVYRESRLQFPELLEQLKLNGLKSSSNSKRDPQHFQLSITSKHGILIETIHCNNYEFSMVYSGGVDRISIIESAARERSETVQLNPQRLLEMVDRNASFASGRIISSKYYANVVSQQFGTLVQKFISGKYSKGITLKKFRWSSKIVQKLQAMNIFSGIILQGSTAFFSVCKKIKGAVEYAMRLDDVLRIPRIPGLSQNSPYSSSNSLYGKLNITQEYGLPLGTKMPMKNAMLDLSRCVHDIDTILVTIKNSLDSLNVGVKIKSSYRKNIECFFLAVKQLEFGHDIDFGTVLMSLTCNATVVQSLSNILIPAVDIEMRSRILGSLGHLNFGCAELLKLVKKICLLSSFVSNKSIGRLRKMAMLRKIKKMKKKTGSCFRSSKNKDSAEPHLKESRKESLKPNSQVIVEQRRAKEDAKLKQLKADLTTVTALE